MKWTFTKFLLIPGLAAGILGSQGCATTTPAGCMDQTSGEITAGSGTLSGKFSHTRDCRGGGGVQANNDFFGRLLNGLYAYTNQSLSDVDFSAFNMEVSATNAYIYNQPGKVKVTLWDDSSVIATRQFDYTMSANRIQLANPEAVRSWALGYEGIATAGEIGVADLIGDAGTGSISVTQTSRYGDEVIASATGHTYVADDGGCSNCMIK